ncbi:MAG: beta-xylosidase [Gemmatimonadota bacterium]
MITSLKIWNEPNNLSHWDFLLDPGWRIYADLVRAAAAAIHEVASGLSVVLGGLSPIDLDFLRNLRELGVLDSVDVLAVHGFPLDWNLWPLEEWPEKVDGLEAEFAKPVWITETGVSSFADEAIAAWGLRRSLELLHGRRVFWYTLLDLAPAVEATTRHKHAEGSAYFRHFHFGLLRWDGTPKRSLSEFRPELGICQWFQFGDERSLTLAVEWLQRLGVRHVRTGLSWAESLLPGADAWFDRLVAALEPFDVCATLCFTPPTRGVRPYHTSPPLDVTEFAAFARRIARRYVTPGSDREQK